MLSVFPIELYVIFYLSCGKRDTIPLQYPRIYPPATLTTGNPLFPVWNGPHFPGFSLGRPHALGQRGGHYVPGPHVTLRLLGGFPPSLDRSMFSSKLLGKDKVCEGWTSQDHVKCIHFSFIVDGLSGPIRELSKPFFLWICVRSQGAYFEGDWGVVVLCTMFLVSCIFFI